jgi:peptidoglycan/LPS O-acetylase OafA/YrhL
LALAMMIPWMVMRKRTFVHSGLSFPPLVWIGRVSYGLYLWHHFVVGVVRDQPWPLAAKVVVGLAISFGVTTISYYLLERPFLKLKERFPLTGKYADRTVDSMKIAPIPSRSAIAAVTSGT